MANQTTNTNKRHINPWEIILIAVYTFVLPAVFLVVRVARNDFTVQGVNVIAITNRALVIIVLTLIVLDITLKRAYMPRFFGCHQKICRSFHVFNKPLPLCARCTGIALGIGLALLITTTSLVWWWFLLMGLPLVIDGALQHYTAYTSNNIKRLISGIGFAPTLITLYAGFHFAFVYVSLWLMNQITAF